MKLDKLFYEHSPKFILLIGIILSFTAWQFVLNEKHNIDKHRFEILAEQVIDTIHERLNIYIDAHYAGVGLFIASNSVERNEWREFVRSMRLVDRYPGINGLGYCVLVTDDNKVAYEQSMQKTHPGFKIKPPGQRKDYILIPYIEPIELNGPAIGFDMGSEINRRNALESSRDEGKPYISANIILVQDAEKTPGFLSYVPVYKDGIDPGNIEDRRKNLQGWVYAPFIAKDFFNQIREQELKQVEKQIVLNVYNSHKLEPERKLYSDNKNAPESSLHSIKHLTMYGQEWTFHIQPTQGYIDFTANNNPLLVLIIGLILSSFIFYFTYSVSITRTKAESLAEGMTAELRKSESKLKSILDTAADGIITINGSGLIQSFNRAAERLFGYSSAEVLNKNIKILMPQSFALEHDGYLENYKKTNIAKIIGTVREVIGLKKDGTEFPIELSVSVLKGYDGFAFSGIVRDITERKKAEADIKEQSIELERSNQELAQFAYITSHDLQEPLRMISSYVELLVEYFQEQGIKQTEKSEKYIYYITDATKRMKILIKDVLDYSRLGKGTVTEAVNIKNLFDDLLIDLDGLVKDKGAQINIESELPIINGHRTELIQLFQNLISNALKFTATGIKPEVTINAKDISDNTWQFSIKDNGIGIEEEYFEKIFVIFQRLHNRESYEGTGIGLAICKKIVEKHDGKIWVESKEGHGTTLYFILKSIGNLGNG